MRRSSEEVRQLIVDAARAVFAEHGYAGATTREIADRAAVTEVLIFRYFGNKAALFDAVVFAPFNKLLEGFLEAQTKGRRATARQAASDEYAASLFAFLRGNSDLLSALAKSPGRTGANGDGVLHGLDAYFEKAATRLKSQYAAEKQRADVDPDLAVRFGFGMFASAFLLGDWLFPGGAPEDEAMVRALSKMIFKALSPADWLTP